jgi:signal peptidase I
MKKKTAVGLSEPPEPDPNPRQKDSTTRHWIAEWVVNAIVLLFVFTSVAQSFVVPTGSMETNVLIGDHIIVDKLAYSPPGPWSKHLLPYQEVRRGDIVVFRWPVDIRQNYVKRVIGVPGDRVKIVAKQLYLNGRVVPEPYKVHIREYPDSYADNFPSEPNAPMPAGAVGMLREHVVNGELVVPPGHYFVLGDNRDNSLDSRYWGFVPRANITGKPWLIYWSYDAPTDRLSDGSVNLDHILDLATNFFSKTRWNRTLRVIRPYPLD